MGWSAGRHVDHPCGRQILPWPARKVTDSNYTHICYTKELFPNCLCNHFGPHSALRSRVTKAEEDLEIVQSLGPKRSLTTFLSLKSLELKQRKSLGESF